MIAMNDAAERAWARMTRGDVEEEQTREISDIAGGMCVGTDVRAPELVAQMLAMRDDVAERFTAGDNPGATLTGALCRAFWIGYEHGAAGER